MKFTAGRSKHAVVLLLVIISVMSRLLTAAVAGQQAAEVPCEKPPGEKIVCERNQFAKCTVAKGTRAVTGQCTNPPSGSKGAAFELWVLEQVLGRKPDEKDLARSDYRAALNEGRLETEKEIIRFTRPAQFQQLR
jgi:hypothetical protein